MIRSVMISLALLLVSALSQASEVPLSEPRLGPSDTQQSQPKVATNGVDFLVAFADRGAIHANRVSASGEVLDGSGIKILLPQASWNPQLAAVVWAGDSYAVIYSSQNITLVARISDAGVLVDGPRKILDGVVTAAATNGSVVALLSSTDVAMTDATFTTLQRNPHPNPNPFRRWISSNGSTFLSVSRFNNAAGTVNELEFVPFDARGIRMAGGRAVGSPSDLTLASVGGDYLIRYRDELTKNSMALRIGPDGQLKSSAVLAQAPFRMATLIPAGGSLLTAGVASGLRSDVVAAPVAESGALLAQPRVLGAGTAGVDQYPSLAWNGVRALVVWTDAANSYSSRVSAIMLGADGSPQSAPLNIPTAASSQFRPVTATGGALDLAAWVERSGVYASRLDSTGRAIDGPGIRIATDVAPPWGKTEVRLVYDGAAYLVLWTTPAGLFGQRIDPVSGVLVGAPIPIGKWNAFDVGRDDIGVVLFAMDYERLVAFRLASSGPLLGTLVQISPPRRDGTLLASPSAAWNGNEWIVVWNELIDINSVLQWRVYQGDVLAHRLSRSLGLLEPAPIEVAVSTFFDEEPRVSSDGRDFLVGWTRFFNGVQARQVRADGSLGDLKVLIKNAPNESSWFFAIVWDGRRYGIGFSSTRNQLPTDLYLTQVGPAGDGDGIRKPIIVGLDTDAYLSLTATGSGRVRAAYTRTALEPEVGGVVRVFAREIVPPRRRAVIRQ